MTRILLENLADICTASGSAESREDEALTRIPCGSILVDGGVIADIGVAADVRQRAGSVDQVLDLSGKTAVPGMVDPHTHLVFGGDRSDEFNRRLHGANYVEIAQAGGGIKSTVRETRSASVDHLTQRARRVLDLMLLHGVTTIEAKSGYGLNVETELKQLNVMRRLNSEHPVDLIQTFMGAHEVPPEYEGRPGAYINMLNDELLPQIKARGDVRYVDIFCERGVFEIEDSRRHLQRAKELGFELRLHADELVHLGGAGLAAEVGARSADHLVYASKPDMKRMSDAGVIATLLPGTSFFLRGGYADAQGFREAGCALALSTDFNPGSSHTCSQALMMALACMNLGMTFEQAFVAVTLNAAAAIDQAHRVGTLEPGKAADIAILDIPNAMHLVYFWGVNHTQHVMKNGDWVVWDRQLSQ